uniref:Transcriptional regulator, AraC family n=1 Tax=Sphingobacterium sp. (strain 21) TaxID=743722 RepID=F4CAL3_SPHS2
MQHYKTLTALHLGNQWEAPQHPLFSMIGCQSECKLGNREFTTDCYVIAFKKIKSGNFMYGRTSYDHDNGCLFFAKPRQIIEMKDLEFEEKGYMLMIHEDYLHGHELFKKIEKYGFFDYEVTEALHLSPKEEQIILELHSKIQAEYFNNPDEYKFNDLLRTYLNQGLMVKSGLPNVAFLADQLFVSPRYLSDLLKQETGKTAMELIHIFMILEAKTCCGWGKRA